LRYNILAEKRKNQKGKKTNLIFYHYYSVFSPHFKTENLLFYFGKNTNLLELVILYYFTNKIHSSFKSTQNHSKFQTLNPTNSLRDIEIISSTNI
jgi:hypothetical protein